jgi:serine/threonine protein kinase
LARGFYTEKDAAALIKQLLSALQYLHDEVNIVHRDLKPENLLFRDPSEDADLIITDFGLSRMVSQNDFLSTTCGTPHYVAPEILKEAGHGKPVDMWATGVITFVVLCGYTPFWGGEQNSTPILYQAIVKGKYEFDEDYWGMISPEGIML